MQASTSLTHTASLRLPPSAASSSAAPVHFDVQKRSEVRGWVGSGAGAGAGDGRNSTTVEAEGEAEVVLL